MGIVHRKIMLLDNVLSGAAIVVGPWVRVAGQPFDVQLLSSPGDFINIEVSEDQVNVGPASDADGNALSDIPFATPYRVVRERPEWVRATISIDASAPRLYTVVAAIGKETES